MSNDNHGASVHHDDSVDRAYEIARERFRDLGVDTEEALHRLGEISISVHCWQGDDVAGFENAGEELGGGLAVTGSYPGRARTPDELRADLDCALSLIPGSHRVNLHAIYADFEGAVVERDAIEPSLFARWIDWARDRGVGLDFNPTFFAHPKARDGFTLAHADAGVRRFWIDHGIACRRVGRAMGEALGTPCVTNVWIPDGYKDETIDRRAPRERLVESLDAIFREEIDPSVHLDAVEAKLFGIGSETYVVGSHEFYLGYAASRGKVLCLDAGHFHPTETIADKISSTLTFLDRLLLHVSRGVRWDSDHVVILSDELRAITAELVRGSYLDRVHVGLDFFDASLHRVAAWVIGTRAVLKALTIALLEPVEKLRTYELDGDFTSRLALYEELKSMPFGAVWDRFCLEKGVPVGPQWLEHTRHYEQTVRSRR